MMSRKLSEYFFFVSKFYDAELFVNFVYFSFIRMFAMDINVCMAQKLGDNFVQLLPESIPFYAELMETGISEVEQNVQKGLQELKAAVGEDIQKYF